MNEKDTINLAYRILQDGMEGSNDVSSMISTVNAAIVVLQYGGAKG